MRKEDSFYQEIEKLTNSVLENKREMIHECISDIIEKAQGEAFMEGYGYAIRILCDNIVERK